MATQNPPCPACQGRRMVVRPDGQQYQLCPVCGGTGEAYDPGLFFTYAIDFNNVAANGNAQGSALILDKPFRWMFATAKSTGTFVFTVQDAKNKRPFQLVNTSAGQAGVGVQNVNFWGTGQNPFPLPIPYEFAPRDQIQVSVSDTSGAQNTINLNFIGVEIG